MKQADYKNWVPKGRLYAFYGVTCALLALAGAFGALGLTSGAAWEIALFALFAAGACVMAAVSVKFSVMFNAFSYDKKTKLSQRIIRGTAEYVSLPAGGRALDVGCGSGALAIAVAKKNPQASVTGLDRWGKEYASFNQALCESNAKAEGAANVTFMQGDAVKLPFQSETFDAVASNYVYHNIGGVNRQAVLKETLRVLKKGGTFAIHDLFTEKKYGDMQAFLEELREEGFEKAELIDTTKGLFMSEKEARSFGLAGSKLLVGKK